MFHKIKTIKTQKNYTLLITFESGEQKLYDIKPLTKKFHIFQELIKVEGLFEKVKVDQGGYGISWNEDIDLSCNELWENGNDL
ncbi:MAG: DUF2442 domain-containing protein [Clostridia bacterium]|jgi:hypothetical protein|nr:DUF2442 domain-containing protein [Clostridia bacterium]